MKRKSYLNIETADGDIGRSSIVAKDTVVLYVVMGFSVGVQQGCPHMVVDNVTQGAAAELSSLRTLVVDLGRGSLDFLLNHGER